MKRVVFIEIVLLLFLILFGYYFIWDFIWFFKFLEDPNLSEYALQNLYYAIFYFALFLLDGIIMVIIAVKPLTGIKPLVEKYKVFKANRAEKKAIKAENDKQAKIAELEKQLDELKKGE